MLKYIGIICFATLFLVSCKKEQPQMTPLNQECDCAKEVSAEFDILEPLHLSYDVTNPYLMETDHVLAGGSILFKAKEENAEYTWYIGADVEHTRQIDRFFISPMAGNTIPITLVVKKKPNKICFPTDDGYDSITRYMHLYAYTDTNIMEGVFRIAPKNSIDSIDLKFNIRGTYYAGTSIYEPETGRGLDVYNFDGNGSFFKDVDYELSRTYRAITTSLVGNGPEIKNFFINRCLYSMNGKFYIKYSYTPTPSSNFIIKEMWGRKL